MAYAQKIGGAWTALSSAMPVAYRVPSLPGDAGAGPAPAFLDLVVSYESMLLWTDAERAAIGVFPVGEGDPPPAGQRVVSSAIGDRNGRPVWVNTFAPIPDGEATSIAALVNAERDRRIASPFTFEGHAYQSDDESRQRIDKSRGSAMAAVMGGAQPGDLRWTGVDVDFFWIALDDTRVTMDAQTMIRLGNASAAREGLLIVAANDLKRRVAAGEVITHLGDDTLWP